jgi:oligopeptide transport system substrate-binding protein
MLESWEHEASINMVKNPDYRDADNVTLERIDGSIIVDGVTRVQAFEAGEVDALDGAGLPPEDIERLKQEPYYEQYPALGTYYYGFNTKNIGLDQRKAMSLAINRKIITDEIDRTGRAQATGMTPNGIKGFDVINPNSPWLPAEGDMEAAQTSMDAEPNPKTKVNLFHNDAPGHKEIAVAVQDMWKELGIDTTIKAQEWAQFLEFLGPPPNKAVDVYRLGWIYDFPDAINGLELFTCDSGNNNTNWCNKDYDALVEQARETPEDEARYDLYRQMEGIMFDEDGDVPLTPIMWYTYPNLESDAVRDTFFISPLDQIDFTKVVVQGG